MRSDPHISSLEAREREVIWEIVVAKYGRDPSVIETGALARASDRHTGAEIEAAYAHVSQVAPPN